jgi:hypothetical protein
MGRVRVISAVVFLALALLGWSQPGYGETGDSTLTNALARLSNPSYLDNTAVACAAGSSTQCSARQTQVSNGSYVPQVDSPSNGSAFGYGSSGGAGSGAASAVMGFLQKASSFLSSGVLSALGDIRAALTNGGLLDRAQAFLAAAAPVADRLVPGGSQTVNEISQALSGYAAAIQNGQDPSSVGQQFLRDFGGSALVQKLTSMFGGSSLLAGLGLGGGSGTNGSPTIQTTQVQNNFNHQQSLLGSLVLPQ